ncbi:uncharacterized protein LOC129809616 [Phlebotomus papatasi]|uniref:uncharacterized protein LOC129809616 n=1 Tax=Phlebotomus papatasi TaxID=29031 RepID=UPI002484253A|nr:uncharacterized protein LOC129809616 [Phlebotomus papatasi]
MWRTTNLNRISFIFSLTLISLLGCRQIEALHLTDISVPRVADVRDTVTLSCTYNMGKHKLNSVKWYKDGSEFFRYAPMMSPKIMTFPVVGVTLPKDQPFDCSKTTCSVILDQLEPRTSGSYRCEISGDAPEFKLISETGNMTIAALPRHDPIITGINQRYEDGDFLLGNCTSDMSSPPAMLSWYINDEKAPPEYLQPLHETTIESDGFQLRFRSLELRFHIDKARHENVRNTMRLKCLARVEQIPTATRESSIAVYIASPDDLTNQKLINYWTNSNSGHRKFTAMLFVTLTTLVCLMLATR